MSRLLRRSAKLPIAPAHFERWLALWHETTAAVLEPQAAALFRDKATRIGESLQLALFFRLPRPGAPA